MSMQPDVCRTPMDAALTRHGWTLVDVMNCSIQGVLLRAERPVREGETFMGLRVAGPTRATEVIERHYCPQVVADEATQAITWERACNRMRWAVEQEAADAR